MDQASGFYDRPAPYYHLHADWQASVEKQGHALAGLRWNAELAQRGLRASTHVDDLRVLEQVAAQAIELAYQVAARPDRYVQDFYLAIMRKRS